MILVLDAYQTRPILTHKSWLHVVEDKYCILLLLSIFTLVEETLWIVAIPVPASEEAVVVFVNPGSQNVQEFRYGLLKQENGCQFTNTTRD